MDNHNSWHVFINEVTHSISCKKVSEEDESKHVKQDTKYVIFCRGHHNYYSYRQEVSWFKEPDGVFVCLVPEPVPYRLELLDVRVQRSDESLFLGSRRLEEFLDLRLVTSKRRIRTDVIEVALNSKSPKQWQMPRRNSTIFKSPVWPAFDA